MLRQADATTVTDDGYRPNSWMLAILNLVPHAPRPVVDDNVMKDDAGTRSKVILDQFKLGSHPLVNMVTVDVHQVEPLIPCLELLSTFRAVAIANPLRHLLQDGRPQMVLVMAVIVHDVDVADGQKLPLFSLSAVPIAQCFLSLDHTYE